MKTTAEDEIHKKKVRQIFELMFSDQGWTDEDLLYHPVPEGGKFVKMICVALDGSFSSSEVMGWLMCDRKKGGSPFKKKRGGVRLEGELAKLGLQSTRTKFHDVLSQVFVKFWPNGQVEQLLRDFDRSPKFCNAVRRKMRCQKLPNELILRTLQNWRKSQRKEILRFSVVTSETVSGKTRPKDL